MTRSLVTACRAVDIPVLDHVIVGNKGFLSMRQENPEIFNRIDKVFIMDEKMIEISIERIEDAIF